MCKLGRRLVQVAISIPVESKVFVGYSYYLFIRELSSSRLDHLCDAREHRAESSGHVGVSLVYALLNRRIYLEGRQQDPPRSTLFKVDSQVEASCRNVAELLREDETSPGIEEFSARIVNLYSRVDEAYEDEFVDTYTARRHVEESVRFNLNLGSRFNLISLITYIIADTTFASREPAE